jgi:hypothetical protein
MASLKDLEKYLNYKFSSGYETGEDYKTFQRKYINYLKYLCNINGWELCKTMKNHYEFSVFFKCKEKYIYMSISDVRYFKNEWYNDILYRLAQNDNDYHGKQNHSTTLIDLPNALIELFKKDINEET